MAFFTFTTVSGSAATNNLVQTATATATGAAGAVTVKLVDGIVTFFDKNGNFTSTGNAVSAYAAGGIPASTASISNSASVGTDLASFQTSGFLTAANEGAGFALVDAEGASSTQIDAFIANHSGAAVGSLAKADLNASQYGSLVSSGTVWVATGTTNGINSLNAAGATTSQVASIVAQAQVADAVANIFQTLAIDNLTVNANYLDQIAGSANATGRVVTAGLIVDAAATSAGAATNALMTDVVALLAKVDTVSNLSFNVDNMNSADLATFMTKVAPFGITSTDATNFSTGNWTTLITNRASVEPGTIVNANDAAGTQALTVTQYLTIPNKFAVNGVEFLNLQTATAAQITSLAANATGLANDSLNNATMTPAQFAALALKVADGEATVDATTATSSQISTILGNLDKFDHTLSNLTITAAQYNGMTIANPGQALAAATPASTTGALFINGYGSTSGVSIDGTGLGFVTIGGSDYADSISTGAGNATVQGYKGSDVIVGGDGADSLSGGNAADTINGGGGNDTITGGNSQVANVLTGGTGNDTFKTNGGVNTIMDLGGAAGNESDVVVNAAVVSSTVTTTANNVVGFQASTASSNSGSLTINGTSANNTIDLRDMGGTVGVTINGALGNDTLYGTVLADSILGGDGDDDITSGRGQNTVTGGVGADTIRVAATAVDTVTDLGVGSDQLVVAANGTVNAAVTQNWSAGSVSRNAGTANLTVANGVTSVDVSGATGGSGYVGWNITAANNTVGVTITGDEDADTITGSASADTLLGNAGADSITAGAGNDSLNGGSGDDTLVGGEGNDTYNVGADTDTVRGLTTGDVLITSGSAVANAASISSFVATAATNNTSSGAVTLTSAADVNSVINLALATGTGGYTVNGGTGNDSLTGSGIADSITGAAGVDTLTGGAGSDTLVGGDGNDTYNVDAGSDVITGLITGDVVVVSAGATLSNAAGVTEFIATSATVNNGVAATLTSDSAGSTIDLTLAGGNKGFTVTGGAGVDLIIGTGLADTLAGDDNADSIFGGAGNDTITGGAGNDLMVGSTGADTFLFAAASGNDTLYLGNSTGVLTDGAADHVRYSTGTPASMTDIGVKDIYGFESGTDVIEFNQGALVGAAGGSTTGTGQYATITKGSFGDATAFQTLATDKFIWEVAGTGDVAAGAGTVATAVWSAIAGNTTATVATAAVTSDKLLFVVDDGTDSYMWYFESAGNSTASNGDIKLIGIVNNDPTLQAADFVIL